MNYPKGNSSKQSSSIDVVKKSWPETRLFILKSLRSREVYAGFFGRNLIGNTGIWAGFKTRDYCVKVLDDDNKKWANVVGFTTTFLVSVVLNTLFKPWQLDNVPIKKQAIVSLRLIALLPTTVRETFSTSISYFNL